MRLTTTADTASRRREGANPPPWHGPRAYYLAAACVAGAFGIRLALDPIWQDRFPYVIFFVAVFVVVQLADTGPVLATLVASLLLGDWFFVPPRHSLLIRGRTDRLDTGLFVLLSLLMLYFSLRTRRALDRERAAQDELQRHLEALRESEARYSSVVEHSMDAILMTDPHGAILAANREACRMFGQTEEGLRRLGSQGLVDPQDRERVARALKERDRHGTMRLEVHFIRGDGSRFTGEVSSGVFKDREGQPRNSTIIRDVTERKQAEAERERLVAKLQAALLEVNQLTDLLPICAHCKKIRDDKGYWIQIEAYLRRRTNASFSHGICPECSRKHFPEVFDNR
ncbi:MAG: PAS domain S-box protein [Verrucomicrobia bacterium]|nr:PAS domain S-box protein [Verrucomicrobiota bacterium]